MIRVLHSVSNMDRAGIETMLMNYYRHIDRTQVQFDFLCNKTKPGAYDEEALALGARIFHAPGLAPQKRPEYMRFMKRLLAEHPEIRILHAHNEAMAEYALEGAHFAGLPVRIFHAHNTRIDFDYKWPLKFLCKQMLHRHYTDMWACGKDAGAFYFGRKPVESGKVRVLHNAIAPERFAFSPDARNRLRGEHGLADKYVIGHVGRFEKQKNHLFLIDAFREVRAKNPRAHLLLLGAGDLEGKVRETIDRYRLKDAVTMTGSVPNTYDWYSAMDVFVLPSLFEGLPVVGVEAQANGLKCLFSDHVTTETDYTGRCAFLPLNTSAWAQAILRLEGEKHAQQLEQLVRSSGYDIKTEADQLVKTYLLMTERGESSANERREHNEKI